MSQVYVFLRMNSAMDGEFFIPSSEAAYTTQTALIDGVYPTHGGTLQADGTWLQDDGRLDTEFSQALPALAIAADQQYIPSLIVTKADMQTVLDSEALQATAIENLVLLLTGERFDLPWDGVMFDISTLDEGYYAPFNLFLEDVSFAVRQQGLPFHVAYHGIIPSHAPWSTLNYASAAEYADKIMMYFYDWWIDPRPIGPYWWMVQGIEYALSQGVLPSNTFLGLPSYANYWPVTGESPKHYITHDQAIGVITDNTAIQEWVEKLETDIVRETYSDVGAGHIWIADKNTTKHRLALIDEYSLGGMMLMIPGMETEAFWDTIAEWKAGVVPWHGYIAVENLDLAAGQFISLLAIIKGQGRLSDRQPANITHSRTVSAVITVTEAVFRYGEMAQDQCIQWVAAVLVVDPADVTLAVAGDVWTLTHGGIDYVTIELFGGLDSTWPVSGAAARAYLS